MNKLIKTWSANIASSEIALLEKMFSVEMYQEAVIRSDYFMDIVAIDINLQSVIWDVPSFLVLQNNLPIKSGHDVIFVEIETLPLASEVVRCKFDQPTLQSSFKKLYMPGFTSVMFDYSGRFGVLFDNENDRTLVGVR